ncbi:alkyl/aryl-sulfatase [Cerasicoccus maritimus]|uniref:alkyl/aryl-sulfatase n=1 Tax=Cerasicoccus maritimus TaxID=490089 RepID=UPI0028526307|nr:alkyl sulfatase dimerization domain-containing protein [Cerasicoccus maritimus]
MKKLIHIYFFVLLQCLHAQVSIVEVSESELLLEWDDHGTPYLLQQSSDLSLWSDLIALPQSYTSFDAPYDSLPVFFRILDVDSSVLRESKGASPYTVGAYQQVLDSLPFGEQTDDYTDAQLGFISRIDDLVITSDDGDVIWDLGDFEFLQEETAPLTVNPSLWRQAKLNYEYGLYEVTDGIYQVRGYDLAVVSFIRGDTGWIVVDPLSSVQTAAAALDLVNTEFPGVPVTVVIHTHSHIDHFGGVAGVVTEEQYDNGEVEIVAPVDFIDDAITENVMVSALRRRGTYMYGINLPVSATGRVDAGLGKGVAFVDGATISLYDPTITISEDTTMTLDGVDFEFVYTPDAEAPTEMYFYLPDFRALCMAELATRTMHNVYSLRGAKVRDALEWSKYLNTALQTYGDESDYLFNVHNWPFFGSEAIIEHLTQQRDLMRFLHDQTLFWMNQGYTMTEISELVELPSGLSEIFADRGYYGTVSHNVRAVYQRYLGFYDSNPANLNPHEPEVAGPLYVEAFGGTESTLQIARKAYASGDYRWAAEVLNHLIFADPDNVEATNLQADTLEQLGYQSESAPWRNEYLTGAYELRGNEVSYPDTDNSILFTAMENDQYLDMMATFVSAEKADGKSYKINMIMIQSDVEDDFAVELSNSAISYTEGVLFEDADATLTINRDTIEDIRNGVATIVEIFEDGLIEVSGSFEDLVAFFEVFQFSIDGDFNIVTP